MHRTILSLALLLGPLPILTGLTPAPQLAEPKVAVSGNPNDWPMDIPDVVGTVTFAPQSQ
jgi:hypothetical protein